MNLNASQPVKNPQFAAPMMLFSIPCDGLPVFSERMHPVYDALVEVRRMPSNTFAIWHSHGADSHSWKDEYSPEYDSAELAIGRVRQYQAAFAQPGAIAALVVATA